MAREGTVEFDDGVLMGGVEVTSQRVFAGEILMTLGPLPPFFLGPHFPTVWYGGLWFVSLGTRILVVSVTK
jgi:hypothetical protein